MEFVGRLRTIPLDEYSVSLSTILDANGKGRNYVKTEIAKWTTIRMFCEYKSLVRRYIQYCFLPIELNTKLRCHIKTDVWQKIPQKELVLVRVNYGVPGVLTAFRFTGYGVLYKIREDLVRKQSITAPLP